MVRRKKRMMSRPAASTNGKELLMKCAWCGVVRGDRGEWRRSTRWDPSESGFSHGICPPCLRRESEALKKR
jgi:hypothetical protein